MLFRKKMGNTVALWISQDFVGFDFSIFVAENGQQLDGIVVGLLKYLQCLVSTGIDTENLQFMLIFMISLIWQIFGAVFGCVVSIIVFFSTLAAPLWKWSIELMLRIFSFVEVLAQSF